ncbi:MAG: crotonase/enoyl-CoA hydratase family protein [Actinomycetota bacterium]|nr:crotonase/enoyl-CoA hydratase family protein [Actinomycetota bacterium]
MGNVTIEKREGVLVVGIDRPHVRNAVDGPTAQELAEAFRTGEEDPGVHAAVLFGHGGAFCAGADLKAIAEDPARANRVSPDGDGPMGPTRMISSKPVIAAVEGHAVAGGLELALWCDLRVASAGARLGFFDRRWGVPLIDGGTVRLPRLIGQARALDLVLTGRAVGAEEALSMGLVTRVVGEGEALEAALALAAEIGRFPQVCLRSDRRSLLESADLALSDALTNEFRLGMETIATGETQEGARRFASGKGRHGAFDDL